MLSRQKRKEAGVRASDQVKRDVRTPAICSICWRTYYGWGNNAEPVNSGLCCTACDDTIVIPARIRQMRIGRRA